MCRDSGRGATSYIEQCICPPGIFTLHNSFSEVVFIPAHNALLPLYPCTYVSQTSNLSTANSLYHIVPREANADSHLSFGTLTVFQGMLKLLITTYWRQSYLAEYFSGPFISKHILQREPGISNPIWRRDCKNRVGRNNCNNCLKLENSALVYA